MPRSIHRVTLALLILAVAWCSVPVSLAADEPPMRTAERAVLTYLGQPASSADEFLTEWITPATVTSAGREECRDSLKAIYDELRGAEPMDIMVDGEGVLAIEFAKPSHEQRWLHCTIENDAPHRITNLWIEDGPSLIATTTQARSQPKSVPVTWDTLSVRLDEEARHGFAGAVLIVHDGVVAINKGYGMANREKHIPNRADTVFAIGSAPIDFTLVGILLLEQEGRLALSDPITKYFDNVPPDKRSITIEYLMTGRSGLQNFHDIPGDRDPDHSYITRKEAMRRIFAGELLFAPGAGREHSHSAWGVLAAILEIASEQTYPDFTRERIFEPLGMRSTGFHGDPIPTDRLAIGYGVNSDGAINAPPYWGTTSWLVMGSGGQVSTAGDMGRFIGSIFDRRLLNEQNTKRFLRESRGLLNGGNAYGFEIYYTYSPGTHMVLLANAVDGSTRRSVDQLARDLGDLVLAQSAPKFSLGIGFAPGDDGATLTQIAPGSAAERDGLQIGDVITGIDGKPMGEDPMELLGPYLETGNPIPFDVMRDGNRTRIVVTPKPRA